MAQAGLQDQTVSYQKQSIDLAILIQILPVCLLRLDEAVETGQEILSLPVQSREDDENKDFNWQL